MPKIHTPGVRNGAEASRIRRPLGRPRAGAPFTDEEVRFYRDQNDLRGWKVKDAWVLVAGRCSISLDYFRHLLQLRSDGRPRVEKRVRKAFEETYGPVTERPPHGLNVKDKTVLPENYWPKVKLILASREFTPKIKIVAKSRGGMVVNLRDLRRGWRPPPGFYGYEVFRDDFWFRSNRSLSEPMEDREKWHVAWLKAVTAHGECSTLEIGLQLLTYRDVVATSTPKALDTVVSLDDGTKRTVREWLAATWAPGEQTPYPGGANALTVNVLVTTSDGHAVISRQGMGTTVSPGVWVASSSGQMDHDDTEGGVLAPRVTANRETREEIGVPVKSIDWLGALVRLDMGWFALLGESRTTLSRREIEKKSFKRRTYPREIKQIGFVKLTPERVADVLQSRNCGNVLSFHLWLVLWRRGFPVRLEESAASWG